MHLKYKIMESKKISKRLLNINDNSKNNGHFNLLKKEID